MNLLVGFLLLPTSGAALLAAAGCFAPLFSHLSLAPFFLGGFLAYPILHWTVFWPSRLYVFGHELTHALAAVISGEKVRKFEVGAEGGHVEVSAVNPFIALAPYCVPLYTLLWIAVFRVLEIWGLGEGGRAVFLAGIGATLSFHLCATLSALAGRKQPDLSKAGGVVFSLALIALANALAVALTLRGFFPHLVSLRAFFSGSWSGTRAFWRWAAWGCKTLISYFQASFNAAAAPS